MNKLTITSCPLCGETHLSKKMTSNDYYATGEQFSLYQCQNCQFLFTQDFPVETEIGKYYETPDYISHSDTKKGLMNRVYHIVRMHMLNKKAYLITKSTKKESGSILDIGTGTGYFSHAMQKMGWKVSAIEKNAQARAFAKQNFNLNVKDESALDNLPENSFDAITLWHVMEHLEKLNDTWKKLYDLLDINGKLIVAVPNCDSYDAQKYQKDWAAYDVPRHLWHFTPKTMERFANKHHFSLVSSHPMPFDAFYVSILSEKNKKHSLAILRGMFAGTIAWIHSLINKEKSSSMIYVLRKENYEK